MKKGVFRFCAGLLAVFLFSVAVVPCYAVSDKYTSTGTFWQAVADKWYFNGTVIPAIIGTVSDEVCSESPDKKHHGSLKTYEQNPDKSYTAICDFCSAEFPVYDADLSAAYDDYVETLPAQGYTSDGSILWSPKVAYWAIRGNSTAYLARCPHVPESEWSPADSDQLASFNCENLYFTDQAVQDTRGLYSPVFKLRIDDKYPIDGYYTRLPSLKIKGSYVTTTTPSETITFESSYASVASTLFYAGDRVYADVEIPSSVGGRVKYISGYVYSYTYSIVPFNPSSVADTYNINTRPTSITGGNYGIVGDNGQITKVEDNSTIINETNNTYYNPATGQTVPITGWSYDYSDRSYKVTLESGDTVTVTYGDENISITETTVNESGDTITNNYTIYYLIDGSSSENPPAACEHDWQKGEATVPTCTIPGKASYVCTKCQQTKTESIPALGHNWQVKQTVTTQYDEGGNLTQEGYTIFECSRCHEQYKSTDGTIPPGGGSGTDPGGEEGETIWDKLGNLIGAIGKGLIDVVEAVFGKILDALISLVEMMSEKIGVVVEAILSMFDELPAIFGGFLAFLTALFPFLPAELMTILTFGILAIVFIGIIKAVRR